MKEHTRMQAQAHNHPVTKDEGGGGWEPVRPRPKHSKKRMDSMKQVPPVPSSIQKSTSCSNTTSDDNHEIPQSDPFVILLVGIPGSGKSTFAKALEKMAPSKYVRINQDTLGSRKKCEQLMRKTLRQNKCPIIDRCNFDPQQRDTFWKIAMEEEHKHTRRIHNYNNNSNSHNKEEENHMENVKVKVQGVECIVFLCSTHICIERCEGRGDTHETIKPENAKRVVFQMRKNLIMPTKEERDWKSLRFVKNYDMSNMKKLVQQYAEL